MKTKKRIADLPDGTVVKYDDGTHVNRGIICRPPHIGGEAVVFTPGGYAGLTRKDRFWSVVPDAGEVYLSEALQAEKKFRQAFDAQPTK